MFSVALVGFGEAGGRFLRTLIYRQRNIGDIYVAAVCDSNIERLKMLKDFNIAIYTNVREMLQADQYDLIVVATNEVSHYEILCEVKKYANKFQRLLVEKLLVETLQQAISISQMFDENDISVHFVERHSTVLQKFMQWMSNKNLQVERASFFWGKCRLYDHRPTIGVRSEISHPIDLILMISGISVETPFKILQGSYLFSDFSHSSPQILDTINVNMKFGDRLIVNGNSSFLWDKRDRRIILYLSSCDRRITHMVTLTFDNPHWDLDTCTISEISVFDGKRRTIEHWEIKEQDINPDIFCISKTAQFMEENIRELTGGQASTTLARLKQACYVQSIVDALQEDAQQSIIETPIFKASEPDRKRVNECDELLYSFIHGTLSQKETINWDKAASM